MAAIEAERGTRPRLIKGDDGVFDVRVDGKLIFSKHDAGRFPEHAEILAKLPRR